MGSQSFSEKVKRNVAGNFDRSLARYRAFEDKYHFFADLTAELARWIDLRRGGNVLDVGCGNGISAGRLSEAYDCRVLGVDLSPQMVADGRRRCDPDRIRLVVGDGERLMDMVGDERFDYVLYNASIFIFPDVQRTLDEAAACLAPGGKIAFSFYPLLEGPDGTDLMTEAFSRMGEALPRFRVVTDYEKACQALEQACRTVVRHRWSRPLDLDFLRDFFSIPAQSASLFPGLDYEERIGKVHRLFTGIADRTGTGSIIWRMAQGKHPRKV